MKIEVKQDVFNIVKRLKSIDSDYFVLYSTEKKCFELHAKNQVPSTYCLSFPYSQLDERALTLALKTRKSNQKELFEEMQAQNERLQRQHSKNFLRSYYGC